VELEGKYVEMLNQLKNTGPINSNAEAIRYALYETTRDQSFKIDELQLDTIQNLLKSKFVKSKFLVYSVLDFVQNAINGYIMYVRENMPSIQDWDVRAELNDNEAKIALALIACQEESVGGEVGLGAVMGKLKLRNEEAVEKMLDDFVDRGILYSIVRNNQNLYHAKKSS
jgi:Arc/MetJ-type ribon-helix-helix transcriptional regulator